MKNLIGMTDFVLEQYKNNYHANTPTRILNYANFLKQPLELWMFVPCKLVDGVWVVLEEPEKYKNWINYEYSGTDIGFDDEKLCREYQQAKEKCLFEGFEGTILQLYNLIKLRLNIEDLVCKKPLLTPTAQKQIGL